VHRCAAAVELSSEHRYVAALLASWINCHQNAPPCY
jgi:hypothetical protein